ncbi:MAG: RloB family protein [Eubacterium sp.]|nr:RloB family protein [Eubacterium sp.]
MGRRIRGQEIKGKKTKDKQKCCIYLFCEGNTERIYLQHFENRIYNVKIIPVETGHTDALGIVKFAKQYIGKKPLNLELGDRGYCVFDSDPKSNTTISNVFNLLEGVREKGLHCIFSNPSFEVWFVLHFKDAPFGYDAKKMKQEAKRLLKGKFPDYCETTDIFEYLLCWQPDALKRAKLLYQRQSEVHDGVYCHECNPVTDMHLFIAYMKQVQERNRS